MNYAKLLAVFTIAFSIFSSVALSMNEDDIVLKEEHFYQIKNKKSGKILFHKNNKVGMVKESDCCTYWKIEKSETYYKIKADNSEIFSYLYCIGQNIGKGFVVLEEGADNNDEYVDYHLWKLEKNKRYYKIKNLYNEDYLSADITEIGIERVILQNDIKDDTQLWSFIPIEK